MEEKNVTLFYKETKVVDITKNLTDIFISFSSFSSDAVFELVRRDKFKNILIDGIVDLDNINPGELLLPHIDMGMLMNNIRTEDRNREESRAACIKMTDGYRFCKYINENSEAIGEALTAYVHVICSERSELSLKACAAADGFNAAIDVILRLYKSYGLKVGTRNVSNSNSEIADVIVSVGDSLCDKLDELCHSIDEQTRLSR